MREAYVGVPRSPQGPVEWVQHKLASRYTEYGRIGSEIQKLEKVMGPLTPEQREEAAVRMILEGKVKNDVTKTIVKDVVVATIVVASGGYLAARPDMRAKIAATLGAGTRVVGGDIADRLGSYAQRVKPTEETKVGVASGILVTLATGAQTMINKGVKRGSTMFEKMTENSLQSMEGRVINADVAYRTAPEKRRDRAQRKLSTLEMRQADAQAYSGVAGFMDENLLPMSREHLRTSAALMVDPNRDAREAKVVEKLAKRNGKSGPTVIVTPAE